jgi:hypothetical protein
LVTPVRFELHGRARPAAEPSAPTIRASRRRRRARHRRSHAGTLAAASAALAIAAAEWSISAAAAIGDPRRFEPRSSHT